MVFCSASLVLARMAKTCYTTVLAEKLHQYRTEDILCDAVIETRDAPVMAHSLILAAASDQLRIAFLAAEKGCRYQLRLDNYTSVDVVSALRYIYTGSLIDDQCQEQLSNFDRTVALLGELGVLTGRTLAFDESIFTGISKEANTILSLVSREDESVCCSKDELSLLGLCSEPESATTSALADTSEKKPCVGLVRSGSVQAAAVEPATVAADSEHSLTGVVQWHKVAESTRREQATTEDKSETPYVCAYCQASFAVAADLLGHLAAHGETTHCEAHPCDVCGKSFVNSRTLHRHRALHVDPKSHECAICGRSFRYRSRLVQHMRVHTGDMAPESSRTCTICSRQFCTASGLRKHRRIHDTDLPFKCTTCHKAFAFASVLREHERTHSAECPYVCEVCGRSFKHSSNLFKHRRQHHESSLSSSSERPPVQQCANCGSSDSCACEQPPSRQPQDLPTTLTKRYQCDICKKCFASSSYREMHARVHTGERPFKCQVVNPFSIVLVKAICEM